MTDYVTTRWYRAPELLLSQTDYDSQVDMWSCGCILAQVFRRKSILRGQSTKNQLELIFELIGTPTEDEMADIKNPKSRRFVEKCQKRKPKDLSEIFPDINEDGIDLLEHLLVFDPKKRYTAE